MTDASENANQPGLPPDEWQAQSGVPVPQAMFAPGQEADGPCGVMYVGEYETPGDGTAVAVRLHARALAATGLPVALQSFSHVVVRDGVPEPVHAVGLPPQVRQEVGHLIDTSFAMALPVIKHLVVRDGEHLRNALIPRGVIHADLQQLMALRQAVYKTSIAYTVWERDGVSTEIVRHLKSVAECWVPCQQNRDMLVASGVPQERVFVMPHPYDPADPILRLTERKPETSWKLFYTIGRWEPRKGQHELIGAFLRWFAPTDNALVTIKYSGGIWPGYPTPEESLQRWLADDQVRAKGWTEEKARQRVRLLGASLPYDQILKLHFLHNTFVSPSHGEAYGLPARDSKLAGNRLVYVGWGGPVDFAAPDDVRITVSEPDDLVQVPESYRWEPGVRWAGYDVDALGLAMRDSEPPARYARPDGYEDLTLAAVGKRMAERVVAVAAGVTPAAGEYLASRLTVA